MKRLLMVVAILMAGVMVTGTANAALLGVKSLLGYPDIMVDTNATITYKEATNAFVMQGTDFTLTYKQGIFDYLSGPGFTTAFSLSINVDESGHLVGTGNMEEKVILGNVVLSGKTYTAGDILLAGIVNHFGWGEGVLLGQFDFMIDSATLNGKLVSDNIWPVNPAVYAHTGIYSVGEVGVWGGNWGSNFDYVKVKSDKAPLVPEPTSLLLLGSGLLGLALCGGAMARKRKIIV